MSSHALKQVHLNTISVNHLNFPNLMERKNYKIRTLQEAKKLAIQLSQKCPNPSMAAVGLTEIFIDAIEHGNLGIQYNTKSKFKNEREWFDEINSRLLEKENIHKYIEVYAEICPSQIQISVKDQGRGFNWTKYQTVEQIHRLNKNGRGILIAKEMSFDKLQYHPPGNQVNCIIFR